MLGTAIFDHTMDIDQVSKAVQEIGRGILKISGEDEFNFFGFDGNRTALSTRQDQRPTPSRRNEFWAWDISAWEKEHVQECLKFLLRECETSPDPKRKAIASRMILYLANQRKEASMLVVDMMESLVMKGFQKMARTMSEQTLVGISNITLLFSKLVENQRISSKASNLGIVMKVCRRLTRKYDSAALVIQSFVRKHAFVVQDTAQSRQKKMLYNLTLQTAQIQYKHSKSTEAWRWPLLLPHISILQMAVHKNSSDHVFDDRTRVVRSGALICFEDLLWRVLTVETATSTGTPALAQLPSWKYEARLRIFSILDSVTSESRTLQIDVLSSSLFPRLIRGGKNSNSSTFTPGFLKRDGLLAAEFDAHFVECLEWIVRILYNISHCLIPATNSGADTPTDRELMQCETRAGKFKLAAEDIARALLFNDMVPGNHESATMLRDNQNLRQRVQLVSLRILRNFCSTFTGCDWVLRFFGAAVLKDSRSDSTTRMWQLLQSIKGESLELQTLRSVILCTFSTITNVTGGKFLQNENATGRAMVYTCIVYVVDYPKSSKRALVLVCLDALDLAIDTTLDRQEQQNEAMVSSCATRYSYDTLSDCMSLFLH